jgi:hypothetical protein
VMSPLADITFPLYIRNLGTIRGLVNISELLLFVRTSETNLVTI